MRLSTNRAGKRGSGFFAYLAVKLLGDVPVPANRGFTLIGLSPLGFAVLDGSVATLGAEYLDILLR